MSKDTRAFGNPQFSGYHVYLRVTFGLLSGYSPVTFGLLSGYLVVTWGLPCGYHLVTRLSQSGCRLVALQLGLLRSDVPLVVCCC